MTKSNQSAGMHLLKLPYRILKDPKNVKKHLNWFRYERSLLRKPHVDFVPPIFVALVSEDCNLRCPTCYFLLQDTGSFKSKFIDTEKFARVLEKYNSKKMADVIFLTGGEAFMHPELDELIGISSSYGFKVKLGTNGLLLKERLPSLKNLSKVETMNISLDAYDYESFKNNRGGSREQFDLILDGLRMLKERGVHFTISFLLSAENISEIDKMLALAERIGPDAVHLHNINPHDSKNYTPLMLNNAKTKSFLSHITSSTDYLFDIHLPVIFDPDSSDFKYARCIQPWYYFFFNASGNVAYCCQIASNPSIGNVFEEYDLNSTLMKKFRRNIIDGTILKKCTFCQRRFMGMEAGKFDSKKCRWTTKYSI